ncbi:MAG: peptidase M49 [Acidobacteria bacterium]|nr:peptidase M49 [Acidobacteriota bacterium]
MDRQDAESRRENLPVTDRKYLLEQVDDAAVVQVYADGFNLLSLNDKTLVWHLYQAAVAGRDIYYDQRYRHSLLMRQLLEQILRHAGDVAPATLAEIRRYTKLFWINTGPYHNITARKFVLKCTFDEFRAAAHAAANAGARFPLFGIETVDELLDRLKPAFFDAASEPMVTCKTPGEGRDILESSANNLYSGITSADLVGFTEKFGLNSRLVKSGDTLIEEVYRIGGRYDTQISAIVGHLTDALPYATPAMRKALQALIRWYTTGDDADRAAYDIAWVEDKDSVVDTINGFVEVYLDARGIKGAWEALVYIVNVEKTKGIEQLAHAAAWFEARMPWDPQWRRTDVKGVTARAIDVVVEAGDSAPVTPIGINLPNDQNIREVHGSKSVSLANINEAYDKSLPTSYRREFAWDESEVARAEQWGALAGEVTTAIHEVLGHGSGRVADHLNGQPQLVIKEHYSALEESRADLVALYFVGEPKVAECGLLPAEHQAEIVQTEYEAYARNALVQLRRIREGSQIEEDHMRNRQAIVHWLMAHTSAIEVRKRDGKTFYVMVDAKAFHDGVGRMLAEVQRIKSEGDYAAAAQMFDTYGIHFDPSLRDEIVARVDTLNLPSYTGFVQPELQPVFGGDGAITDVVITYPQDLEKQMLGYTRR